MADKELFFLSSYPRDRFWPLYIYAWLDCLSVRFREETSSDGLVYKAFNNQPLEFAVILNSAQLISS